MGCKVIFQNEEDLIWYISHSDSQPKIENLNSLGYHPKKKGLVHNILTP